MDNSDDDEDYCGQKILVGKNVYQNKSPIHLHDKIRVLVCYAIADAHIQICHALCSHIFTSSYTPTPHPDLCDL